MSWRLTAFGDVPIPEYNGDHQMPTGAARIQTTDLMSGGAYDLHGVGDAPLGSISITAKGWLLGPNLREQLIPLRACAGKRARLYRDWDDGKREWTDARCEVIDGSRNYMDVERIEAPIRFLVPVAAWYSDHHGEGWKLGQGIVVGEGRQLGEGDTAFNLTALNGTPQNVSLPVTEGRAEVRNAIIRLKAGNAAITSVTFEITGRVKWTWVGTLTATKTLTINTGNWQVLNDGANAWAGLTLDPTLHRIPMLFSLLYGTNTLKVTGAGGGSGITLVVDYSEANL